MYGLILFELWRMTRVCKLKFEALGRLFVVYIFLSSFHSYSQTFNKIFSFFFVSILQGENVWTNKWLYILMKTTPLNSASSLSKISHQKVVFIYRELKNILSEIPIYFISSYMYRFRNRVFSSSSEL